MSASALSSAVAPSPVRAGPSPVLRDYPIEAVEACEQAAAEGRRRALVVLPTGAGKTVAFAELIRRRNVGGRARVIAHRDELLAQARHRPDRRPPGGPGVATGTGQPSLAVPVARRAEMTGAHDCPVCAYAVEHGWWGPGHQGTHCRSCHRSWTSTAQAHCVVCCAHFVTDGVAGMHWRGGHHVDPATVEGLFLGPDGLWSTSPDRDPVALRERLNAGRRLKAAS